MTWGLWMTVVSVLGHLVPTSGSAGCRADGFSAVSSEEEGQD